MAIDRVKPLKLEDPSLGGTESDPYPRETDPSEDYGSFKGIAFEGLDTHLIDKIGRVISSLEPNTWQVPAFNANGTLNTLTYYNSSSFISANRLVLITMGYDGNLSPTSEVWQIYDTDGTTVLRTMTYTNSFSGVVLSNTAVAFT